MDRSEVLRVIREVALQNRIKRVFVFGSFARRQAKCNDLDIAIDPPKDFTLLDLARVANAIEEKTGVEVDLVTIRSIHPKLRPSIEKEMVAV